MCLFWLDHQSAQGNGITHQDAAGAVRDVAVIRFGDKTSSGTPPLMQATARYGPRLYISLHDEDLSPCSRSGTQRRMAW